MQKDRQAALQSNESSQTFDCSRATRRLRAAGLIVAMAWATASPPTAAQSPVYRCETNGKVSYSDSPCVGAKVVDATPTQGMDKMTGSSRKGREVQRDEWHQMMDNAMRPLQGKSHEEMNVVRHRVSLPQRDQSQCARLDGLIPTLESEVESASNEAKVHAEVDLYKARKQYFNLKC